VRPFLIACALFLIGATAALAQPDVRPFEPFLAASPLPQTPLVLRDRPGGTPVATLGAKTEFGSPETVGVAVTQGDWLGVISTKLPNGVLGWVKRTDVQVRPVVWSIEISLSSRTLVVEHDGVVLRSAIVGIGAADSPTPPGRYVVTDHIDPAGQGAAYGCCILALSGHQPHPPAGWNPSRDWRLAIHGGATGAVSAGCIHADAATLRLLMRRTPLGTPVTITR
jgi:L,D-transpeptidase-like protein